MALGCIADDFNGAGDLANTRATGGMCTRQFVGVPSHPLSEPCDAGVVALKASAVFGADAVSRSLAALNWLREHGCIQFVFKYCWLQKLGVSL